jgi:hypothetical protein
MNIQIDEMALVEGNKYRYILRYGDKTLDGEVEVELHDADGVNIRSLDLRPSSGYDLLAFASAHSEFAKDFWAFVDRKPRPFPWNYGNIPEEHLKKVFDHYQL